MSADRVRYFAGQLLSVNDFADEQQYHLERRRLLTRILHGTGVVDGLHVHHDEAGGRLVIEPGHGIDRMGRLIDLPGGRHVDISSALAGHVVLRVTDESTRPVPVDGSDDVEHGRWHERVDVSVETCAPDDGLVIATISEDGSIRPSHPLLSTHALQSLVERPAGAAGRRPLGSEVTPAGPISPAVDAGPVVFCSAQGPFVPATGELAGADVATQTTQSLTNLFAVLAAGDLGPHDVQKCTVYLVDLADLAAMDAAYSTAFDAPYPARTTVGVAALPGAARVQIELVARRGASR